MAIIEQTYFVTGSAVFANCCFEYGSLVLFRLQLAGDSQLKISVIIAGYDHANISAYFFRY